MATEDENAGMGTTGAPNISGVAAIDEPGEPTGAANVPRTGGALDDPDLPFDRRPADDDPVHRAPRYGQR